MEVKEYPALDERVYRERLENGLTVMVVPKPGFSRKVAYFVTDFGSVHTEFTFQGQDYQVPAGVAHYLEHKLFDMPGQRDVSAEFAAMGAVTNAFTSYDMTAYYFSCTEHFSGCLKLLLEFVSTPYFTEESVERERGIIDQEIGMYDDDPGQVFDRMMQAAYHVHPIRVPILGTHETIREITPEILQVCHEAFYAPGNMMLCVVGDVDPEEVRQTALDVLGNTPRPVGEKHNQWPEPLTCPQPFTRCAMEVAMPTFSMAFKTIPTPPGAAGIRRELVADLAAEALFGESSELYLRLYEEGLIDSSFGGGFETVDGCAMMVISGDADHPEIVRDRVLAQAGVIARQGISEASFRRMLRSAMGSRVRGLDSFDSTCFRLCACHFSGFDYLEFPALYAGITPEEIREFIRDTIREECCCLSVVTPLNQGGTL